MRPETQALIFGLVALVSFGVSTVLQKQYISAFGPVQLTLFRNFLLVLILTPVIILFPQFVTFDSYWVVVGFAIAAASYFGLYFLNRSLEDGKVGIVVPITGGRVVITSAISFLFLGELVSTAKIAGILVSFIGIVLISINFRELRQSNLLDPKTGAPYAMLAALVWGVTFAFFGGPSAVLGGLFFAFIVEIAVLVMSIAQEAANNRGRIDLKLTKFKQYFWGIFAIAFVGAIGTVGLNLGFATGVASITAAVSASSPLLSTALGLVFFKERLSGQQYLGTILAIGGIIVLSLA